jgi:hypothetical protein
MNTNLNRIDPSKEDAYWQSQFDKESYRDPDSSYDDYKEAYRTGYEGYHQYQGRTFDEAESDLQANWERTKGNTQIAWDKAKNAVKAAWHRVEEALPGDADNDGR